MAFGFSITRNTGDDNKYLATLKKGYANVDMLQVAKDEVAAILKHAVKKAVKAGALPKNNLPDFVVEIPANTAHGDFAANLAMVSAKAFGLAPRKIAEAILPHLPAESMIQTAEIAGPGFINVKLRESWFSSTVMAAVALGEDYGRTDYGKKEKVNVEFVSANPTGPMHLGNARGGALGDCLSAALDWAGYTATREFYVNDAGNQIVKFGKSLAARYLQLVQGEDAIPFPEDGYQGEDIKQRAEEFRAAYGDTPATQPTEELEQAMVDYALPKNIESLQKDLAKYNIHYDVWFRESTLHQSGEVDKAVKLLTKKGATYTKDGALWYKATDFGAEKDEVLLRANGIPTYFAADIAYHINKFSRGFTKAIDVWGADHHGHVARMKGVLDAAGIGGDKLDIVLMQFVTLMQDGQPVKMSKRTGKAITLTDLLDEVPLDSARFFFNLRDPGSRIEFDLDLAVAQDSQNPVYYVQYAHARICSILRALEAEGTTYKPLASFVALEQLTAPEERELIRKIASFPAEIIAAAKSYDPARITRYTMDIAGLFHKFYTACHVKGEEESLLQARLALCIATKTVLANSLSILKVTAPEQM